jgi:hypothetical protein
MRVPAQGGAPELVTTLDPRKGELDHIAPVFLPDGKRFVYVARQAQGQLQAKWGSLDGRESGELPIQSGLLQYAPLGYLLFPREGAVFAQTGCGKHETRRRDLEGRWTGEPGQHPVLPVLGFRQWRPGMDYSDHPYCLGAGLAGGLWPPHRNGWTTGLLRQSGACA